MRRLHQILSGEAKLDDLLTRYRREAALEERVHRALPPALAKHVAVIDARTSELELGAASGAVAALLRQRAPDLRIALAHEGWEFTGIRVRVQARLARESARKFPKKQLDSATISALLTLASELGESELSQALRRLATRTAGPSGGGDESLEGVKDEDAEQ